MTPPDHAAFRPNVAVNAAVHLNIGPTAQMDPDRLQQAVTMLQAIAAPNFDDVAQIHDDLDPFGQVTPSDPSKGAATTSPGKYVADHVAAVHQHLQKAITDLIQACQTAATNLQTSITAWQNAEQANAKISAAINGTLPPQ
jgi:hypothetical protein